MIKETLQEIEGIAKKYCDQTPLDAQSIEYKNILAQHLGKPTWYTDPKVEEAIDFLTQNGCFVAAAFQALLEISQRDLLDYEQGENK